MSEKTTIQQLIEFDRQAMKEIENRRTDGLRDARERFEDDVRDTTRRYEDEICDLLKRLRDSKDTSE